MNCCKNFILRFKYDYKLQGFPSITTGLLTMGSGYYALQKMISNDKSTLISRINELFNTHMHESKQTIPIIPPQTDTKPTIVFDIDNFLVYRKYPLISFWNIARRAYTGTFLFNMAHIYDLILVTKMNPHEGRNIIQQIDPYGCISYRLFVKDKHDFRESNLNRNLKKTIFIETGKDEFNKDFQRNSIKIEKWNGKEDDKLLSLLNFCVNMHFSNVKDYRNTLCSYKGKDFYKVFDFVSRKIFREKNLFCFNLNKKYENETRQINETRIKAYSDAKLEMDQHIAREMLLKRKESVIDRIYNVFVSNLI